MNETKEFIKDAVLAGAWVLALAVLIGIAFGLAVAGFKYTMMALGAF